MNTAQFEAVVYPRFDIFTFLIERKKKNPIITTAWKQTPDSFSIKETKPGMCF